VSQARRPLPQQYMARLTERRAVQEQLQGGRRSAGLHQQFELQRRHRCSIVHGGLDCRIPGTIEREGQRDGLDGRAECFQACMQTSGSSYDLDLGPSLNMPKCQAHRSAEQQRSQRACEGTQARTWLQAMPEAGVWLT